MSSERGYAGYLILAVVIVIIALGIWFVTIDHEVTVSVEGNGTVEPMDALVGHMGSVELVMVPDEGWSIGTVTVDGESVKVSEGKLMLNRITDDIRVDVTFVEVTVDIVTVTLSASEGGTITPEGEVSVTVGSSLTFSVEADAGYRVSEVTVGGEEISLTEGSYTLVDIDSDITVVAGFYRIPSVDPPHIPDPPYVPDRPDGPTIPDPELFRVYVVGYERTESGDTVTETYVPGQHTLDGFQFMTDSMSPGDIHTVTLSITNGTDIAIDAELYVSDIGPVGTVLADHILISVDTSGEVQSPVSLNALREGELTVGLGDIPAGGTAGVTFSILFAEYAGSDTMNGSLIFTLGIRAGEDIPKN